MAVEQRAASGRGVQLVRNQIDIEMRPVSAIWTPDPRINVEIAPVGLSAAGNRRETDTESATDRWFRKRWIS